MTARFDQCVADDAPGRPTPLVTKLRLVMPLRREALLPMEGESAGGLWRPYATCCPPRRSTTAKTTAFPNATWERGNARSELSIVRAAAILLSSSPAFL